ncbi:MAG: hypothetical protein OEM46_03280 [Ignavibacteria bacterium]|nr:hypothetical protein [Ignavibacteria bacterium]
MKIIISDTSSSHADNTVKPEIVAICPTAEIEVRIETMGSSVSYAIFQGDIDLICRATAGLDDVREKFMGQIAAANGIGIIHAHGLNTHTYLANPTYIGTICAVGCGNATPANTGSYGPGLEFFANENTQSETTGMITGMIAQLMIDHDYDFDQARLALRISASSYPTHIDDGGYGLVDYAVADALEGLIETDNEKWSLIGLALPMLSVFPEPDSEDFDQADLQQLIWLYRGILIVTLETIRLKVIFGLKKASLNFGLKKASLNFGFKKASLNFGFKKASLNFGFKKGSIDVN